MRKVTIKIPPIKKETPPNERIEHLRLLGERSQEDMANLLFIKPNTYTKYENGTRQFPVDLIVAVAKLCNSSTDFILGLTDEPKNNIADITINKELGISPNVIKLLRHITAFLTKREEWKRLATADLFAEGHLDGTNEALQRVEIYFKAMALLDHTQAVMDYYNTIPQRFNDLLNELKGGAK